jgi:hypothetical protein
VIDKYLISNCLLIIDEFNEKYKNCSEEKLRDISDLKISEADLVVSVGYPFRQMATFNMQGKSQDIVIESKDFVIEVKYLRNFNSKSNNVGEFRSNKLKWEEAFQKDFNWLTNEIKNYKKGKRAFILGWFNVENRNFADIMQLGAGTGKNPLINKERMKLFPFLNYDPKTEKTNDIKYRYGAAYKELTISLPGIDEHVSCMFVGKETDKFHFVIYW